MSLELLEEVLNTLVDFARVELERGGDVPPVAGAIDNQGEVELHMPRADDGGTTEEFLDLLRLALRHGVAKGEYTATGLCMLVTAHREGDDHPVDAIAVHLEAPGESLMAFLPYGTDDEGEVEYGEIFFGPAEPHAFASNGAS